MAVPPYQDSLAPSDSGSDYSGGEPSGAASQSDHKKHQQHPPPSSATNQASNSGPPELPWIPSSAVTSPDHYGGLNPENLASLSVINTVPAPDHQLRLSRLNYLGSLSSKTRTDSMLSRRSMQGSQNISSDGCPSLPAMSPRVDGPEYKSCHSALDSRPSSSRCFKQSQHALGHGD